MSVFLDPNEIVKNLNIQVGIIIADCGAGSGGYSLPLGRALMSTGKVYAIDVNEEILNRLAVEAREKNILNIDVIQGDIEKMDGTPLVSGCIDMIVLSNTLFSISNRISCIDELKRILKPGGSIVFIEWEDSFGGIGPDKDHIIPKEIGLELFIKKGFVKEKEIVAGTHHYGFLFKKL